MSAMDWYASVSRDRGVSLRCQFASAEQCPRYFLSQWVLNSVEGRAQNRDLEKRWTESALYPSLPDDYPSASGGNNALHYGKFCPEVAYERFGRFASELTEYYDVVERQIGQQELSAGGPDWKAEWLNLTPRHFTECPLYSPLLHSSPALLSRVPQAATEAPVIEKDAPVVVLRPTLWGISVDLHEVWKRGQKWLSGKVGWFS